MSSSKQTTLGHSVWALGLSYGVGALALMALIYISGIWNFIANTRILDLLIKGGVVAYHDGQMGFVEGVEKFGHYLKSQEPIDWSLILVVVGIFWFFWLVKGLQFHVLCRAYGVDTSLGQSARIYFRGLFYARHLPFRAGDVATVTALEEVGTPKETAHQITRFSDSLIAFEIISFAAIGLVLLGWGPWLTQLFWPLVAFALIYWWTRGSGLVGDDEGLWSVTKKGLADLADRPRVLVGLAALSLLAFGVEDVAAYTIAQAFSGEQVRLYAEFNVLLMGVVGSYLCRFIPLTPGGIGQFEWGFALALLFGGLGMPEAVAIAVLDNAIRYGSYWVFYFLTTAWSSTTVDMGSTLRAYAGAQTAEGQ